MSAADLLRPDGAVRWPWAWNSATKSAFSSSLSAA